MGEDIVHFNTLWGVGVIGHHPISSEGEIPKNH